MFRDKILIKRVRNAVFFSLIVIIILSAYKNIRDARADETTIVTGEKIFYFNAQLAETNNSENVKDERVIATANGDETYSVLLPKVIDGKIIEEYYLADGTVVEVDSKNGAENVAIVVKNADVEGDNISITYKLSENESENNENLPKYSEFSIDTYYKNDEVDENTEENTTNETSEEEKTDKEDESTENKEVSDEEKNKIAWKNWWNKNINDWNSEVAEDASWVIDDVRQNFAKNSTTIYITAISGLESDEELLTNLSTETVKLIYNDENEVETEKISVEKLEESIWKNVKENAVSYKIIVDGISSKDAQNLKMQIADDSVKLKNEMPKFEAINIANKETTKNNEENEENAENTESNENENSEETNKTEQNGEENSEVANNAENSSEESNIQEFVLFNQLKETSEETEEDSNFLGLEIKRKDIGKIVFTDEIESAPETAIDVSSAQNGSIIAWKLGTDVYVGSKNIITANYNSSYLFANIDAGIEGLNKLHTFTTTNMDAMFAGFGKNKIQELNLGDNFNTSNVQTMQAMFRNCGKTSIEKISLGENFDTQNVTDMREMFQNCGNESLTALELGAKFNTANVKVMNNMFENCGKTDELIIKCGSNTYSAENELKIGSEIVALQNAKAECTSYAKWNIELVENDTEENDTEENDTEENNEEDANTENSETIVFKLTPEAINTEIKEINLNSENLKVLVDGEVADNLNIEITKIENEITENEENQANKEEQEIENSEETNETEEKIEYLVTISNFEEKNIQENKQYKEWSGYFKLEIAENSLISSYGNGNLKTYSEEKFMDNIKPLIKSKSSIVEDKKYVITFDVTDKYFSQSTISAEEITILIDGAQIDSEKVEKKLEGKAIEQEINGENKTIGAEYTLTINEKEKDYLKSECTLTMVIKAESAEDTTGNKNIATTLSMQISLNEEENNEENKNTIESNEIDQKNNTTEESIIIDELDTDDKTSNVKTSSSYLMCTSDEYDEEYYFFENDSIERGCVNTVHFETAIPTSGDNLTAYNNTNWDVSALGNGTVKAWYTTETNNNSTAYNVYIANTSGGSILANPDSSYLFAGIGSYSRCNDTTVLYGLENLNTSNVTNMSYMFYSCGYTAMTSLTLPSSFNTSNVTNMSHMFSCCGSESMTSLTLPSSFNTSNVTNMSYMFSCCGSESMTSLTLPSSFNTSNVTNMSLMFYKCGFTAMTSLTLPSSFNTSNVTDMGCMFNYCGYTAMTSLTLPSSFDTSNVTNMSYMFQYCGYTAMTSLTLPSSFDTSNVINMSYMFYSCGYTAMTSLTLSSSFDTSNVTDMGCMFQYCGYTAMTSLTLPSSFDTSNVTNMSYMFQYCGYTAMTSLTLPSSFDTSNVINMSYMFYSCGYTAMTSLTLPSSFDTSNVTDMSGMFNCCGYTAMTSLTLSSSFDTSNVTDMKFMFCNCGYTSMTSLYLGASFKKIAENYKFIFANCGKSGYNVIYVSENIYSDSTHIKLSKYSNNRILYERGASSANVVCQYTTGPEIKYKYSIIENEENPEINQKYKIVKIVFTATDNSTVTSNLIVSDLTINVGANTIWSNGNAISGMNTNNFLLEEETITNGKKFTLTITGLDNKQGIGYEGYMSISIPQNKIYNENGNGNIETVIQINTNTNDNIDDSNESQNVNLPMLCKNAFSEVASSWGTSNSYINSIHFVNGISSANNTKTDISYVDDGSIYAWYTTQVVNNVTLYNVYVGATAGGTIYANTDSRYLFYEIGSNTNCNDTTCLYGLEYFNTSNATNMYEMFRSCGSNAMTSLTLPSSFDTSNVINMHDMFENCGRKMMTSLDLGDGFDTSNVTDMYAMFYLCGYTAMTSLDFGDNFNTSNVTNMGWMFQNCGKMSTLTLPSSFDTSNVIYMDGMFYECGNESLRTLDLGDNFNTSNVTKMNYMFGDLEVLRTLDLGDKFDTSNVTDMSFMFYFCKLLGSYNLGNKFDTGNVTDMAYMFCGNHEIMSLDLGDKFDTGKVTDMDYMFQGIWYLEYLDLGPAFRNVSENHENIFQYTNLVEEDYADSSIVAHEDIYYNSTHLRLNSSSTITVYCQEVLKRYYSNTGYEDGIKSSSRISYCSTYFLGNTTISRSLVNSVHFVDGIASANSTKWDVSDKANGSIYAWYTTQTVNSTTLYNVYIGATAGGKIYANTDSSCLFYEIGSNANCNDTTCLYGLEYLDTSRVKNMEEMFYKCGYTAMTSLILPATFKTDRVTNMLWMFLQCGYTSMTELDLGDNFDTSSVTNMCEMFYECGYNNMETLELGEKFNTSKVIYMECMFEKCGYTKLVSLNLGDKFDTSKVIDMEYGGGIFTNCGYTSMEYLDLGPKFKNIVLDEGDGSSFVGCGKSGVCIIYVPEEIYYDSTHLKLNSTSTTTIEYTRGLANNCVVLRTTMNTDEEEEKENEIENLYIDVVSPTSVTITVKNNSNTIISTITGDNTKNIGPTIVWTTDTNNTLTFSGSTDLSGIECYSWNNDKGNVKNDCESENDNVLSVIATGDEKTYYVWAKDKNGNYSNYYTAVTIIKGTSTNWNMSSITKTNGNVTFNLVASKEYITSTDLTKNKLRVYIDDKDVTSDVDITLGNATINTSADTITYPVTISNLKQKNIDNQKGYRDYSGNIRVAVKDVNISTTCTHRNTVNGCTMEAHSICSDCGEVLSSTHTYTQSGTTYTCTCGLSFKFYLSSGSGYGGYYYTKSSGSPATVGITLEMLNGTYSESPVVTWSSDNTSKAYPTSSSTTISETGTTSNTYARTWGEGGGWTHLRAGLKGQNITLSQWIMGYDVWISSGKHDCYYSPVGQEVYKYCGSFYLSNSSYVFCQTVIAHYNGAYYYLIRDLDEGVVVYPGSVTHRTSTYTCSLSSHNYWFY